MRIVLDLQAYQSPGSRRRGIGRYSLALAKAMAKCPRGHDITLLLNAAMGDSIELLRAQFDSLLPQDRIVTWQALSPAAYAYPDNAFRRYASEALRMQALRQLKPDVVHVASLFEGFSNEVIATVPKGQAHLGAVTLYDLIPLAQKATYLHDRLARRWYMEKIEHLRQADILLGISRYSCEEAVELLDIPRERLTDISGAVDDIFVPLDDAEAFRQELMHRYGLRRSFIMYTGGFDSRKNIAALVRAFALLPMALRCAHQLVIVGEAPPIERAELVALVDELGLGPDEVVFAGYVPDRDLVKLYNVCALYVFPSLQEGFGLPALEAMASGAVVIGSNTSSLPEVIGCEEALFDPRSDRAIAAKMVEVLTDEGLRNRLREHAVTQCQKFSWEESARRALEAFEASAAMRVRPTKVVAAQPLLARPGTTAFLPAPASALASMPGDGVKVYADSAGASFPAPLSLADYVRDRDTSGFDRIIVELADEAYCARTLELADTGAVDIVLADEHFGAALQTLAEDESGRALVMSLLYAAGGYPALRAAISQSFSRDVLGTLVTPQSLTSLGRSQVISLDGTGDPSLAWRDDIRGGVAALVAARKAASANEHDWAAAAAALASNMTIADGSSRWLVDISNLAVHDAGTGIQRVVRHILDELLASPPPGVRIEPVRLADDGIFRYARSYCQRRYFEGEVLPPDEPVEFSPSDLFLGLDLAAHLIPQHIDLFRHLRNRGVRQYYVVYDLLPLLRPDCFDPPGLPLFRGWYESIAEVADGVICISRAVADEFESWLHQARPERLRPLSVGWFHLGADLSVPGAPTLRDDSSSPLAGLDGRATFLMVGTVEPRKGHAQTLAAFEQLWQEGVETNLLIIGKPGWLVSDLLERLANHSERGKRLFWFEKAGDELLLSAYQSASALIMASEGEGFGLPLIEAAHHGLPLIARDLPVFREIAGSHAHYFSGYAAEDMVTALRSWLALNARAEAPQSSSMTWLTWKQAAARLTDVIGSERWTHRWLPGCKRRFPASDYRWRTEVGRLSRGRLVTTGEAGQLLSGPGVPLEAGCYSLAIRLGGMGNISADICSGAGEKIHGVYRFTVDDASPEGQLLQAELQLDCDVMDLEIRVDVEAGTGLWVQDVELTPLSMNGAGSIAANAEVTA